MKILVLSGSPRINGNTAKMVERFVAGVKDAGHDVETIWVGGMKINGCISCEYCHGKGEGKCVQQDDMQKIYPALAEAEMVVFASPVYYWSFSGQIQSVITRFYAPHKPAKATKYAMLLTSHSPDVYNALVSQFNDIVDYFDAENVGVITACGDERTSDEKLNEVYLFGKNL